MLGVPGTKQAVGFEGWISISLIASEGQKCSEFRSSVRELTCFGSALPMLSQRLGLRNRLRSRDGLVQGQIITGWSTEIEKNFF
jgi:hypothetical protein